MSRLSDLLAAATPQTFWQALYASRYTGRLVLDCRNGVPKVIEIPAEPTRIILQVKTGDLTTSREARTLVTD